MVARHPIPGEYANQTGRHAVAFWPPATDDSTLERLAIAAWHDDPTAVVRVLHGCAAMATANGDSRRAALLRSAADTLVIGSPVPIPFHNAGERTDPASCPYTPASLAAQRGQLTYRESEVLELLGQRRTDAEIAAALSISRRTASSHVGSIMSKLGVNNRRDAVAIALGYRSR
jgi:DNA-binding CsgD family transcriptional regulator